MPSSGPDILLVSTPPWLVDCPQLGLATLAAYAQRSGYETEVLDLNIELYSRAFPEQRFLWTMEEKNYWERSNLFSRTWDLFRKGLEGAIDRIALSEAPVIGFSVAAPKQFVTIEILRGLARRGVRKKILLGGPACQTAPERHIFTNRIPDLVDCYVVGEGEQSLVELLDSFRKGEGPQGVAGVTRWENDVFTPYTPRKPTLPMEVLSRPTYDGFPLDRYTTPCLVVEFSRGCVSDCGFCQVRSQWGTFRVKKARAMVEELADLHQRHGTDLFTFADPAINGHRRQFLEFCDLLAASGLKLRWSALLLALWNLEPGDFERMRAAGCYRLEVGAETGSPRVLELMNKSATIESTELALRSIKAAGMQSVIFLLTGFPGELEEDFQMTLDFVSRNRPYIDMVRSVNALYLQEGTDVEVHAARYGIEVPPDRPETWNTRWRIGDTNTPGMRLRRVERLLEHLAALGIPYQLTSLDETGGDRAAPPAPNPGVIAPALACGLS
ncbi:MAG: radical SAM protein [Candidatus Wallbacteria bacterium]|nr:radical SAM protein [Candidatus Wallbacteria bacterium]